MATPDATHAAERGWYLGVAYSNVSADYAPSDNAFPTTIETPSRYTGGEPDTIGSPGFKLVGGFRALDWLAFEADYLDLSGTARRWGSSASRNLALTRYARRPRALHCPRSRCGLWASSTFSPAWACRTGTRRIETINPDGSRFWHQDLGGTDEKFGAGRGFFIDKGDDAPEYERLRFSGDAADTGRRIIAPRISLVSRYPAGAGILSAFATKPN